MLIGYEVKVVEKHLTSQQQAVLDYIKQPRTSAEIAQHLGVAVDTVYVYLRLLQRLDLAEKISFESNPDGAGRIAKFAATGRQPKIDPQHMSIDGQIAAHNPFGRVAA